MEGAGPRSSSSRAGGSGIQFPPSPALESAPDRFLSSFAIILQVYICKKAAGHGAVCEGNAPHSYGDHPSPLPSAGPGARGQRPKPGALVCPRWVWRADVSGGDGHCPCPLTPPA